MEVFPATSSRALGAAGLPAGVLGLEGTDGLGGEGTLARLEKALP